MSSVIQAVDAMRSTVSGNLSILNLSRTIGLRVPVWGLFVVALFLPKLVAAQKIYSPEHPEVRAMCDKAMKVLTKQGPISGARGSGTATLRGLAVLQYHKRYNQRVPKDDPYLKKVVEHVAGEFPDSGSEDKILGEQEMYYPCLAMILLAEYDKQKYKNEIKAILKMIKDRQLRFGAHSYKREKDTGDTSQTQFVALALTVAKTHGFDFDVEVAKRSLEWFVRSQKPTGAWVYKPNFQQDPNGRGGGNPSLPMQAAGIGSVYLLADVLQLFERVKSINGQQQGGEGLPKTVRIYVKPVDDDDGTRAFRKEGPLVGFDRGRLGQTTKRGNQLLVNMFSTESKNWKYYYLYALERYAFFREQAEGNVAGIDDWYDQTIEFLKKKQTGSGGFSPGGTETADIATSFAVLFMVRSSEVINLPSAETELDGDIGFTSDVVLRQDSTGRVRGLEAERNLADTLQMMKEGATDQQMREVAESLKKQISEFRNKDDKSRGEIKAFLRSMIGATDFFRRLIAVRFLAGEQDMDNVPALIYALGDPDFRIAIEAHNGLRLISRKIDSLPVSRSTQVNALRPPSVLTDDEKNLMQAEFSSVKKKWSNWFLKIRPGAELLD